MAWRRMAAVLVLAGAVAGCESNPGGPAAPAASSSGADADSSAPPAKGKVKTKGHGTATGGLKPTGPE